MRINTNVPALHTNRMYGINNQNLANSLEKMSSAKRINRASDDAAGLAISEKMKRQLRGLRQASRNGMDAVSFIQVAEGALDEVHNMLQRMRELCVQGANGVYEHEDLGNIIQELKQLEDQIGKVSEQTNFNGLHMLKGEQINGSELLSFQIGTEEGEDLAYSLTENSCSVKTITQAEGLSLKGLLEPRQIPKKGQEPFVPTAPNSAVFTDANGKKTDRYGNLFLEPLADDIAAPGNFREISQGVWMAGDGRRTDVNGHYIDDQGLPLKKYDYGVKKEYTSAQFNEGVILYTAAIDKISAVRGKLGAMQNRLESTVRSVDISHENILAAQSRIEDIDMAREMSEFTKHNILAQSSVSMLGHANELARNVLQLIKR